MKKKYFFFFRKWLGMGVSPLENETPKKYKARRKKVWSGLVWSTLYY